MMIQTNSVCKWWQSIKALPVYLEKLPWICCSQHTWNTHPATTCPPKANFFPKVSFWSCMFNSALENTNYKICCKGSLKKKKKAILVFSKLLDDWIKLSILEIWKLFVLFMFTKCFISYCKLVTFKAWKFEVSNNWT